MTGKRIRKAISKAIDQAVTEGGGSFTEERVHGIFREMCEHDQFLRWEFQEEAHKVFIDSLVREISDRLFGPGRESFTPEEMELIHDEIEKRRQEGWEKGREREAARRARFRVVKGGVK
jgi:hypothetical protein